MSGAVWDAGRCWRCEADDVPVIWLGPVQTQEHGAGPFAACEPCIRRLEQLVETHHMQADRSA
ncbi:hypothetical protein [Streptomyces sp. 2P-4]|uniref:hypothetical protein n=1 Tax=Streptomyces sp. 2P-4 TaxID=2931974 RepID=UPI00253FF6DE|nr:hypothetical protein [Streptomyces sp. 2P-4]